MRRAMSFLPGAESSGVFALQSYKPPEWAKGLQNVPKFKLELSMSKTPIHKWLLPGVPDNFHLFIKRDDMTGSTLSGNKIRKLEFLLADAIKKGCKHIITAGGIQSNHCRATAIAAAQLGIKSHVFLRSETQNPEMTNCTGNFMLDRMVGSEIYLIQAKEKYEADIKPKMMQLAEKIKFDNGEDSYLIPIGGSDSVGVFGYITFFQELLDQRIADNFDDIVVTVGSGGTTAGLAIANHLTGNKFKVHAICVCDNPAYFHNHVNSMLHELGLKGVSEDMVDIIGEHKGRGYGISMEEELNFIREVSSTTGILLDPVYTGKAAKGLAYELVNNCDRFKGNRVLFIHTGGIFGLMDGRMDLVLSQEGSIGNKIYDFSKLSIFKT